MKISVALNRDDIDEQIQHRKHDREIYMKHIVDD